MSIAKIQSGDTVKVTSGNYKGTVGVVTSVRKKIKPNGHVSIRASVSEIPKIAKYRKSQVFQGQTYPGAIMETDRTVDISNLSLVTKDGAPSKSKVEVKDGKKVRVLKKSGDVVVKTKIEKTSSISTQEVAAADEVTTKEVAAEEKPKKAKKSSSKKTNSSSK